MPCTRARGSGRSERQARCPHGSALDSSSGYVRALFLASFASLREIRGAQEAPTLKRRPPSVGDREPPELHRHLQPQTLHPGRTVRNPDGGSCRVSCHTRNRAMTLTLTLPDDLYQRVLEIASRHEGVGGTDGRRRAGRASRCNGDGSKSWRRGQPGVVPGCPGQGSGRGARARRSPVTLPEPPSWHPLTSVSCARFPGLCLLLPVPCIPAASRLDFPRRKEDRKSVV